MLWSGLFVCRVQLVEAISSTTTCLSVCMEKKVFFAGLSTVINIFATTKPLTWEIWFFPVKKYNINRATFPTLPKPKPCFCFSLTAERAIRPSKRTQAAAATTQISVRSMSTFAHLYFRPPCPAWKKFIEGLYYPPPLSVPQATCTHVQQCTTDTRQTPGRVGACGELCPKQTILAWIENEVDQKKEK